MSGFDGLNAQFAIPGAAKIITSQGGLAAIQVDTGETEGLIYLHGGHVAQWRPKGHDEVLWLSTKSQYVAGKPIRGGVPICFPWFGPNANNPAAPMHGFARLRDWRLESIEHDAGAVTVVLQTASDAESKKWWDAEFVLTYRITMGMSLTMALEFKNTGPNEVTLQEALHTYFSLGDAKQVKVSGLEGVRYVDKMDGAKTKMQEGAITIAGETDRVYLDTTGTVTIEDPDKRRRIVVAKEGSHTTVVWNPWIAKAAAMADFGNDEWTGMMCVETCNVGDFARKVAPWDSTTMTARISVERF